MNMVKYGRELFEVSDSKLGQVLNTDFDELRKLANRNVDLMIQKDGEYGASWRKRGGAGAFLTMSRKIDRIESMMEKYNNDIFKLEDARVAESLDDTLLDLSNYCLLILETRAQIKAVRNEQSLERQRTMFTDEYKVDREEEFEEGGPTPAYVNQD
jgi:hypothetical protein